MWNSWAVGIDSWIDKHETNIILNIFAARARESMSMDQARFIKSNINISWTKFSVVWQTDERSDITL